ncbi:CehA/McbA family metallohydrolase [Sphingomonas mollis]|uniref:CehA/McbA family metallohydrolase n=1 Tax=Sphingomonas mollis TaxID=2795726 RepID=A0ABS0XTJ1_9SPHN|nr:CehA/McbA family metallohydrolase [Sphingomonas sp. BT553]MBJ6123370.1 CehA/McbA family metallohydrolase [Sphingomonas sp. BT553]
MVVRFRTAQGILLLWLAAFAAPVFAAAERPADVTLQGVIHDADRATTRDLPFVVPAGTALVRVDFTYEGRDRGVTITLGVADPQRFRGWGGGTKYAFAIGDAFATPSFLPGPIPAGRWRLMMTVPAIRTGDSARWSARIRFSTASNLDEVAFAPAPIRAGPGWYRGDLHSHSGQSDARCRSYAGREAGCPPFYTFQEAAAHGLDFVALTDHNVTSHFIDMGYLQPHFDTLLLMPGRELTTRDGHANLLGYMGALETDIGRPGAETVNAMLASARATGGFLTINHPSRPTGEDCLGCGWAPRDTDYANVDAIEVVNGGSTIETPGDREAAIVKQVRYWEALLDRGYRLVGVAGSDNHDAIQYRGHSPIGLQAAIGSIATVVHADDLSQGAILRGLRSGRAFVDLDEGRGRVLDMTARRGNATVAMGGTLPTGKEPITAMAHVEGVVGGQVALTVDGERRAMTAIASGTADLPLDLHRGVRQWFRVDVLRPDGRFWLIGNPVYVR